jgi:hypothetical protein
MYHGERLDKDNFSDINSEHLFYRSHFTSNTKMTASSFPG